jgi:hypothetical protein
MITGFIPTYALGPAALDELRAGRNSPSTARRRQRQATTTSLRCIHERRCASPIFLGPQRACTRDYILAEGRRAPR